MIADEAVLKSIPHVNMLSSEQVKEIHNASLQILQKTGIRIHSDEARKLLGDAGCPFDGDIAHPSGELLEWAIQFCPSEISLYRRTGELGALLKDDNVHFGTGSDCPHLLDPYTHKHKDFTRKDMADSIRVCDALPNIDYVMSMGLVLDVPPYISDRWQAYLMLANTSKPVLFTAHNGENCVDIIQMLALVAGGKEELRRNPIGCGLVNPVSPLQWEDGDVKKLVALARAGVPMVINGGPMMGGTGPMTMAGIIAMANAEVLTGILLAQLTNQGTPIIYGLGIHPLDMRTAILAYGAPELAMTCGAAVRLSRYYDMPCFGYSGCSDAKIVDQEAAMTATMYTMMSLMTGANLVHDAGYLECGRTSSTEMLVLCDLIIGMCRRIMTGIDVSENTLALDLIDRVGPGGNFLTQRHTITHMRETWYSPLIERIYYPAWEQTGRVTLGDKITHQTRELIEKHQPEPLPGSVQTELIQHLKALEE